MTVSPVQDFILQSEQNFRTAAAVAEAWQSTRVHIADGFLGRLSTKLLGDLSRWNSHTARKFFEDSWASFWIEKETWSGEYGVTVQAEQSGRKMVFGIQRDDHNPKVAKRPLCPEVLDAVRPHFPSVKSKPWWDAQVLMRNPASDWTTPTMLWRMHTDPSFLDAVAGQLLAVAKATEAVIDRLTKKK